MMETPISRASAARRGRADPATPARPRNIAAQTEQRLLDAAEHAFCSHGYLRTTVQDIVDRTGLSRAAFYRYFRSTDDIFVRLVTRVVDGLIMSSRMRSGITLRDRVRDSNQRYFDIFAKHRGVLRAMFEASHVNPQIAAIHARMRATYLQRVRDHLRRQQAGGRCLPLDPDTAALSLTMMVAGIAQSWILMGLEPFEKPMDAVQLTEQVTDIWCRAVYKDPDQPQSGEPPSC